MTSKSEGPTLHQIYGVLLRRAPLVLLSVGIVATSAFLFSKNQPKRYTATASLLFHTDQLGQEASGLPTTFTPNNLAQQHTNVRTVTLGDVAAKTATKIGQGLNAAKVRGSLEIAPDADTDVVSVSSTARSPLLAQAIANTYAAIFVAERRATATNFINNALRLVRQQYSALSSQRRLDSAGLALADRIQSLEILAQLQTGNVQLAQLANPPASPSSPKVARNTVLGGILGLILGLALAFVLERLDVRIKDPADLESLYGLPLLAVIPESSSFRVGVSDADARTQLGSSQDEVFRLLRAYLRYFDVDRDLEVGGDLHTILVVSAGPGDGKTTVSYNLAKAAASTGARVLYIEADLRRTGMRAAVHPPVPGLADVLIGAVAAVDAIRPMAVSSTASIDVLASGPVPPPNPAELLESRAMETLLELARREYEMVIIDTPPLILVADAIPLLTKVDGVIVVARIGTSRRDIAQQLRNKLTSLRAPVLGVVANRVRQRVAPSYHYGYGYGDAYGDAKPVIKAPAPGGDATNGTGDPAWTPTTNGAGAHEDRPAPVAAGAARRGGWARWRRS